MKQYFHALCMMLIASVLTTSCLGDDEETALYSDTAITAITLGTLNRYIQTTTDGVTSTTKVKVTGSSYVMNINQLTYEISNPVALPAGTDIAHVVCTVTTRNNGVAMLLSESGDEETYYAGTDSIDFTNPRTFRVYSSDGTATRDYTVTLNVEESEGDYAWHVADATAAPAALQQEYRIKDATESGFQLSTDGGATWTSQPLGSGEEAGMLPTDVVGYVSFPYSAAEKTDYQLLVGSSNADDQACVVWRRIYEYGEGSQSEGWVYMPLSDDSEFYLPKMSRVSLVYYEEAVLAVGTDGNVYKSRDYGITWKVAEAYALPERSSDNVVAATDEDGVLWLKNLDDNVVWKWSAE